MNQRTLLNFFALMIMKSKCNIRFAVIHGDRSNLLHEGQCPQLSRGNLDVCGQHLSINSS